MSTGPAAATDCVAVLSEPDGILDGVSARVNSPVLVGRAGQLAALDDALVRAQRGGTSAVLIGGDAGVGKSRLISEFSTRARGGAHADVTIGPNASVRVLTGGAWNSAQMACRSRRSPQR